MARSQTATVNGERRKHIEDWLDDKGVAYEYVDEFDLTNIDREKSLHNQARLGEPLNDAFVEEYREALRRGDKFPAIIVAKAGARSKAVNIDGNHRYEAAIEEGQNRFGAYVVKLRANTNLFGEMSMEANVHHGKPTSSNERVQQAIHLIRTGMGIERAAATLNVPLNLVRAAWDKAKVDERAAAVGIKQSDWDTLVASVKLRLQALYADEVFKAAARLAVAARLTTAEVDEVVTTVNSTRSTEKQLTAVRSLRRSYADRIAAGGAVNGTTRGRRGGSSSPRRRFSLVLTNLMALPDNFSTALSEAYGEDEKKEAARQAREAAQRLEKLADDLEH